ncbi:hypothetical protein [Parabacteroides sp. ZJ-118]|uniref:hypothetical protein n=1 Tax=Parabacteroides sp. ZJ-118 TaxID=2709398 RepID=UPI00197FA689|nr:hypothetical protein [Parabacteroides sp. ZJ-118]
MVSIHNPYQNSEHKVYNRTFMRSASADVEYADISLSSQTEALTTFFKDNFGVDFNPHDNPELASIKLTAEGKPLSFDFHNTNSSVLVGAEDYKSFADTMQPNIGKLVSFLQIMRISNVSSLSIKKNNQWDLSAEDIMNAYKSAIPYTFADENIREVAKLNVPDDSPKPIKLSREANVDLGDGRLVVYFFVEIIDEHNLRLVLELKATAANVKTSDVLSVSSMLNDVIYGAFHDLITPDIIGLMDRSK